MRWASRLVAREVELAILEDERRRVMAGELRCVLLTADAGVGKTRLASEFLARNRGRCVTLSARGSRLADTASFGLWVEALERRLRDSERAEVLRLCEGAIDELADLLRSVAAARGGVPEQHPPRTRLLEAITFLVGNLARDAPVLVLLDDAQLADTSSWHALNHLARNLEERPVLIIVAGRRAELAADVLAADVLLALEQDGRLSRLTLPPLGADGVRELAAAVLGREPPRGLIDWLRGRALGNPLFVIGLLQGLLAQGDLSSPALDAIPSSLGDAIASQVRALDRRERGIVELLAVTGRAVEVRDLPEVEAATLETLARSGLVIEAERGRALALEIAHPLIQDAIYERIGALRRRELHRHVGRQLLRAGRLGDAAPHFARSADPGDWEAIDALRAAMRQAERRASYQEAMTILDALVELLPTGDARWADVLDDMAWRAEWVVDHRADMLTEHAVIALRAIEAALGPTTDPARRAAVSYRLASFLGWGTGDLVGAERACREARRWYASAGDHAAVLLADNELAHQRGLQGDYVSMEAEAVALAAAARAAGESFARMQALAVAGFAAGFRGRVGAAEALLTVSADLALTEGKRHRRTVALTGLACALAFAGRVDEARAAVRDAESGDPFWRDSQLPEWRAMVAWCAGDFPGALALARDALTSLPGPTSKRRAIGLVFAALAGIETGDRELARDYLARARSAYAAGPWHCFADCCDHADALLGAPVDLGGLEATAGRLVAMDAGAFAGPVLLDLAELAGQQEAPEVAGRAAGHLERLAARLGGNLPRGLAGLARAWAHLAACDAAPAVPKAETAVAALSSTGCRAFTARAHEALGRALSAKGDRDAAVAALESAASQFGSCGAQIRQRQTLEALRTHSGRGRRAAAAVIGPSSLTPREREVSRLAARGRTAREIGAELCIGERTVETHLANAYPKLRVHSKADLIRRGAELAL